MSPTRTSSSRFCVARFFFESRKFNTDNYFLLQSGFFRKMYENIYTVILIELVTACQAGFENNSMLKNALRAIIFALKTDGHSTHYPKRE